LQNVSHLLQAARADAVHAFLVLLDLLKGHAEAIGQVGLAELQHRIRTRLPTCWSIRIDNFCRRLCIAWL
jgi:hypothetical protein